MPLKPSHNLLVRGSNPCGGTNYLFISYMSFASIQTPEKKESHTHETAGKSEVQVGEPTKNPRLETRNGRILRIIVNRELATDCVRANLRIRFAAIVVILGPSSDMISYEAPAIDDVTIIHYRPTVSAA